MNYRLDEISEQIERFGGKYDPNSNLSIYDQLYICQSLSVNQHIKGIKEDEQTKENVNVKWNANDTCKHSVNNEQKDSKQNAITKLKTFDYRTPPNEIAKELEILFADYFTKQGHWLYIAQNWNPRAINRVIDRIIKLHITGSKTIKNPAAYFTYLIKMRKKRRSI